jgi:1-acyl-sn-glycerol-3-phosphate acyltransferase
VTPVYPLVIGLCLTLFRVLRWRIEGRGVQHVPARGAAVVATNHVSYLDFVLAGYGVRQQGKRRLRFVAKREIFDNPYAGPVWRARRHIGVDRGGDTDAVMDEVARALAAGDLVGMFPEGTISRSFVPLPGRPGAARMAMAANVPLIPGAVWGSQRIYTKGRKPTAARGTVISVAFGPAIPYTPDADPADVHGRLMAAIGDLVDQLQRTYPQQPAGPDDRWWLPAHLGGTAPTPEEAERMARDEATARRARRQQAGGSG